MTYKPASLSTYVRSGIALLFPLLILAATCNENELINDAGNSPYFGFNAKGRVNVQQQLSYAGNYFTQIDGAIKRNIVIRVTGGTVSQKTYKADWTPDIIDQWVQFQKKQHIRFIYVVNGNDTPGNQRDIIQKWISAGARFDFIEMMNEYYLPKYARGDTSRPEVSQKVTPEKYVNELLPEFWAVLDQFHLPYYIIFAPERYTSGRQRMEHWNRVMTDAVNNKYANRTIHATLHLYTQGTIDQFDYNQIDSLRSKLPAGRHIAVTEAGVIDPALTYKKAGELAVQHYQHILGHLKPGDYLLDQILYNPSKNNNTADLNPGFNGTTPKGEAILHFINKRLN